MAKRIIAQMVLVPRSLSLAVTRKAVTVQYAQAGGRDRRLWGNSSLSMQSGTKEPVLNLDKRGSHLCLKTKDPPLSVSSSVTLEG